MMTVSSISSSQQEYLDAITERILSVVQPQRIVLFGSAVRDQLGPDSDLDLLVVVNGPVHRRALAQEIYRNLHGIPVPVDVLVVTEQDVNQYGDSVGSVIRPALREGRVIYDRHQ